MGWNWKVMNMKVTEQAILVSFLLVTSLSSIVVSVPCPPKSHESSSPLPKKTTCTRDVLKFGVCGSWLGLVTEVIGTKPSKECCALVKGLADLEAALCLCTVVKADVLGVGKLQVPVAISTALNSCGKKIPDGFICA